MHRIHTPDALHCDALYIFVGSNWWFVYNHRCSWPDRQGPTGFKQHLFWPFKACWGNNPVAKAKQLISSYIAVIEFIESEFRRECNTFHFFSILKTWDHLFYMNAEWRFHAKDQICWLKYATSLIIILLHLIYIKFWGGHQVCFIILGEIVVFEEVYIWSEHEWVWKVI